MKNLASIYCDELSNIIYSKITKDFSEDNLQAIAKEHFYKAHILDKRSANFQVYYFKTLNNKAYFLQAESFFKDFKYQYSLQGIDNAFLNKLESDKPEIIKMIEENELVNLYFKKFRQAKLKRKESFVYSEQGSFFSKLVHTFKPNEFCALDNPVKDYFNLKKENFFNSFIAVSQAYKNWSFNNQDILIKLRESFKQFDEKDIMKHDKLTDLKILDLIFWSMANNLL